MAGGNKKGCPDAAEKKVTDQHDPDWATGLKQLYDSVVDEPLPDSFKDLLSKLDKNGR